MIEACNIPENAQQYRISNHRYLRKFSTKITNKLEALTKAYVSGDEKCNELFEEVKAYHFSIIDSLFKDHKNPIFNDVANTFVEIEWLLEEKPSDPADYLYDQIVSIGEMVSTKIIAAYFVWSWVLLLYRNNHGAGCLKGYFFDLI